MLARSIKVFRGTQSAVETQRFFGSNTQILSHIAKYSQDSKTAFRAPMNTLKGTALASIGMNSIQLLNCINSQENEYVSLLQSFDLSITMLSAYLFLWSIYCGVSMYELAKLQIKYNFDPKTYTIWQSDVLNKINDFPSIEQDVALWFISRDEYEYNKKGESFWKKKLECVYDIKSLNNLSQSHAVKIHVIQSMDEMIHYLKKYKNIKTMIITGHGNEEFIQLNGQSMLASKEIVNNQVLAQVFKQSLKKDAAIILHTCSSAKPIANGDMNIAQSISAVAPGRTVIAPSCTIHRSIVNKDASINFITKAFINLPPEHPANIFAEILIKPLPYLRARLPHGFYPHTLKVTTEESKKNDDSLHL